MGGAKDARRGAAVGSGGLELTAPASLRKVIDTSVRGIFIVDGGGTVRYANPAAGEIFAKDPASMVGGPLELAPGGDDVVEIDVVRADGSARRVEMRVIEIEWNGRPAKLVTLQDMTERHASASELRDLNARLSEANARLARLVHSDPLTELLNRRGLAQALAREVRWMRRRGDGLLVLLLDLDDFKRVNDTYGHAVGDVVLRETALRLRSVLRRTDTAARIGGDEFLVLLPDTRLAEGHRVAEKIRLALERHPIHVQGRPLHVTASMGLIEVSADSPTIDELLARTHEVLYASKRAGKNRVTVQRLDARVESAAPEDLEDAVRRLTSGGALRSLAQPILRLADERVVGFEFLTRSTIPVFERPDDFFRLCGDAKSLTRVDRLCFAACARASEAVPEGLWRHLNLFPSTLIEVPPEQLLAELPAGDLRRYCVEISEQQIVGDPSYLLPAVEAFRRRGLRVALDDVGFGQSSMESLILLEPDLVKIDRRSIHGIARESSRARALRRLLRVLDSAETEIVAEGIEEREELEALRELGVRYGQGFAWGEPRELEEWARPRRA